MPRTGIHAPHIFRSQTVMVISWELDTYVKEFLWCMCLFLFFLMTIDTSIHRMPDKHMLIFSERGHKKELFKNQCMIIKIASANLHFQNYMLHPFCYSFVFRSDSYWFGTYAIVATPRALSYFSTITLHGVRRTWRRVRRAYHAHTLALWHSSAAEMSCKFQAAYWFVMYLFLGRSINYVAVMPP